MGARRIESPFAGATITTTSLRRGVMVAPPEGTYSEGHCDVHQAEKEKAKFRPSRASLYSHKPCE